MSKNLVAYSVFWGVTGSFSQAQFPSKRDFGRQKHRLLTVL